MISLNQRKNMFEEKIPVGEMNKYYSFVVAVVTFSLIRQQLIGWWNMDFLNTQDSTIKQLATLCMCCRYSHFSHSMLQCPVRNSDDCKCSCYCLEMEETHTNSHDTFLPLWYAHKNSDAGIQHSYTREELVTAQEPAYDRGAGPVEVWNSTLEPQRFQWFITL